MDRSKGMWFCSPAMLTVQNMGQNQNGIQMWWHTPAFPALKEALARGSYICHQLSLCIETLYKEANTTQAVWLE